MLLGSSPPRPPPKRRKRNDDGQRRSNPFIALEASEGSDEEGEEDDEDEDMESSIPAVDHSERMSPLVIFIFMDLEPLPLGNKTPGDPTPTRGLDYLSVDAGALATRFKEKAASSDAARSSGVLEESVGQALVQPTIDDYEIYAVPFRTVSNLLFFTGLF